MASGTPRKISRRRAMVALGTGFVGSTVAKTSAAQRSGTVTLKGKHCKFNPSITTVPDPTATGGTRRQLKTDGCCGDLSYVLNEGYKNAPEPVKTEMADFIAQMNKEQTERQEFLDFCHVQFDLTDKQLKALQEWVRTTLPDIR